MKSVKSFILILVILAAGLLTACDQEGSGQTETNQTETDQTASDQTESGSGEQAVLKIPENSILYFNDNEGSQKLMQYFKDGNIPEEATVLYDQMGGNPEITITDPEKIEELYRLLSMVEVIGETNESITDSYHHVQFKLGEDSYAYYSFEGSDIWCYENQNYSIENSKKLFAYIKDLTDDALEQED